MQILTELLGEIEPVNEHLTRIYSHLPEATLAHEQERLERVFVDIGSRLVTLGQIEEQRGAE